MTQEIDIIFDGPPSPLSGGCCCFVEIESPPGRSIRFGNWVKRQDGFWALRFWAFTTADIRNATAHLKWEDREQVFDILGLTPYERERE